MHVMEGYMGNVQLKIREYSIDYTRNIKSNDENVRLLESRLQRLNDKM